MTELPIHSPPPESARDVRRNYVAHMVEGGLFLGGMALVAAWWGVWHILSGLVLAWWFARRPLRVSDARA